MIKAFIQYNGGAPTISLKALKSDTNSCNVLKLMGKALDKGEPTSKGLASDFKHLTLTVATNMRKQTNVES